MSVSQFLTILPQAAANLTSAKIIAIFALVITVTLILALELIRVVGDTVDDEDTREE